MPYIKQAQRKYINGGGLPRNAGELNYLISIIIIDFLERERDDKGHFRRSFKYQDINDVLGALEGAKLEFYRRIIAPYEDIKIKENGDI